MTGLKEKILDERAKRLKNIQEKDFYNLVTII
jgi:hypothetical protein